MSEQYHLGNNPDGSKRWHSKYGTRETYWCGSWSDYTPLELKSIAETLLRDLRKDHPEVFLGITREQFKQYTDQINIILHTNGRVEVDFKDKSYNGTAPSLHSANQGGVAWWLKQQKEAEIEELTMEQLCKELGREIKIIK